MQNEIETKAGSKLVVKSSKSKSKSSSCK